MDISSDSYPSSCTDSESDAESEDYFRSSIRIPPSGHTLDPGIQTAIKDTKDGKPIEAIPDPTDQKANDVNRAVMKAVLLSLEKFHLNPVNLSDDHLREWIIFVTKNVPYQEHMRSGSVETQKSSESNESQ